VEARAEHATAAGTGYRSEEPRSRPLVVVEQRLEIDPETGIVLAITHVRRSDDS
jgi:hypothetical protein